MKKSALIIAAAAIGLAGSAAAGESGGPTLMTDVAMDQVVAAGHAHWLETPGTFIPDIGSGQTSISDPEQGGYHQFHNHVHLGTPGTFAFGQGGQVSVGKYPI